MIEGLKYDVTSEEIVQHVTARANYHKDREAWYSSQIEELEKGMAEPQEYTNGDPIRNLKDTRSRHTNKREIFEFLAAHTIPNETYRLLERDLADLEMISSSRY